MSVLSRAHFYDEKAAFEHVESVLWPEGPTCPKCGCTDRIRPLNGVRSKPSKKNPQGIERHGLKKCYDCRSQFTVRIGTIFEESHIPLHKWLQAIHLMCSSKKGISSNQLHRVLEITVKSAWFLSMRIREAMRTGEFDVPLGGKNEAVEVDETFIGRKKGAKKRRGTSHKMAVLSLVQRGGSVRSFCINTTRVSEIGPIVNRNVASESWLLTDEAKQYVPIGKDFEYHFHVNHGEGEYVDGPVHTNTIEGFFSIFKRGMKGIYQHCSEKHLHRYLAEYDFRYNNRIKLGVNDSMRSMTVLQSVVGKRLTYRGSSQVTAFAN